MNDLISRQAAIDAIKALSDCPNGFSDTYDKARIIGVLEEVSSAQPEQRWIPCDKELPETGQDVILCCAVKNIYGKLRRYICVGYYVHKYEMESNVNWDEGCDEYREEDDKFYVLEGWYERIHNWDDYGSVAISDFTLAWMPLPEPYREDGEE